MLPAVGWLLTALLAAGAASSESLDLSSSPADVELVDLLWERSPDLVAARAKLGQAEADVVRSEVLPNPGFDFQWGTLAIGPTNPPGLDKLKDVPNYTFTLNQPFEIAKRGPRQAASRAARPTHETETSAERQGPTPGAELRQISASTLGRPHPSRMAAETRFHWCLQITATNNRVRPATP